MPSVVRGPRSSNGVWGGLLGNLPAGSHRTFLAQAFDASGTLLFRAPPPASPSPRTRPPWSPSPSSKLNAPPPFLNEAPVIDSLVAASTSVPAGGTLSLAAAAHDSNPGDTLSYAWSSTAGSFSPASAASTSWTAPASTGIQTLTLTVTDSGASPPASR